MKDFIDEVVIPVQPKLDAEAEHNNHPDTGLPLDERYSHGSLLAEKGAIQTMIAQSAAEIQGARLMTLDAACIIDSGEDARVAISLIKSHGAAMLNNVIDRAIQVHGALGVTSDRPPDKMYRDARYARIYDGPDEVHHMVVARKLLKDYKAAAPWS